MCSLFKKPKVVSAPVAADAPILRNPYLDGLDAVVRARQSGVRSLTIRKATGTPTVPGATTTPSNPTLPATPNVATGNTLSDLARPSLAITSRTLSSKV
ncbi:MULTISPECIES: hypothetical protein [Brevundimonas]|uniref:hypothetical protein n=1 Tax=Brevundimonas TaxID=41275 RepID=UPI0025C58CFE|nr:MULTISPECIES: hypothetical protein [Brevundimonas]